MDWWFKFTEGLQALSKSILWILGACVAAILAFFVWKKKEDPAKIPEVPAPSTEQVAVDAAHEAALKERIEASAVAEQHKAELQQILEDPDGSARRAKLAALLKKL